VQLGARSCCGVERRKDAKPGLDFVPLTATTASARTPRQIPGGFFKRKSTDREGNAVEPPDRPSDRPLMHKQWTYETQSWRPSCRRTRARRRRLALIGGSASLVLSDIPFPEPVAAVRVGRVDASGW